MFIKQSTPDAKDDLVETCRVLFSPGQLVELRQFGPSGTVGGYFTDSHKLAGAAIGLNREGNCYVTMNPIRPELLERAPHCVRRLGKGEATSDTDILSRRWLLIDVDPTRPKGMPANDEQHIQAQHKAEEIAAHLWVDCGWPMPIIADSGNGSHVLVRVEEANDDPSREKVRQLLQVLAARFSDQVVKVDRATFNAARITKFYGTVVGQRVTGLSAVPAKVEVLG